MAALRMRRSSFVIAALLCAGGCQMINQGDPSYVTGLRVLGVKAEPPEVAPGSSTTLTALAVDTQNRPISVSWAYCTSSPPLGADVDPNCAGQINAMPTPSYIHPFGTGVSAMMVMPQLTADQMGVLGSPDRSGGVYLPVSLLTTAGTDSVNAIYHLRVTEPSSLPPANTNPLFAGLYQVMPTKGTPTDGFQEMDGGTWSSGTDLLTSIDPGTQLTVHSGDKLQLRAYFTAASAEKYMAPGRVTDAGTSPPRSTTETLDMSWFSTAGTFSDAPSSMMGTTMGMGMGGGGFNRNPDQILTMDNNLPASGGTIDIWVVGRDNRGGSTDLLHRTLKLQ
jgi:hypothetical protein